MSRHPGARRQPSCDARRARLVDPHAGRAGDVPAVTPTRIADSDAWANAFRGGL
jgi:hypothetical protein